MGFQAFDERVLLNWGLYWDDSLTPGYLSMVSALGYGGRIDNLMVSNSDAVDHIASVAIHIGGLDHPLGSVTIPAGSGYGGLPAVDVIPLLAGVGFSAINVALNQSIWVNVEEVVNTGKVVTFAAFGGQF